MTAPSDRPDNWHSLTPEQQAKREVAARAVLTECFRLVGVEGVVALVLKASGRE